MCRESLFQKSVSKVYAITVSECDGNKWKILVFGCSRSVSQSVHCSVRNHRLLTSSSSIEIKEYPLSEPLGSALHEPLCRRLLLLLPLLFPFLFFPTILIKDASLFRLELVSLSFRIKRRKRRKRRV